MIANGIDVGGTKIKLQIFDTFWQCVDKLHFEISGIDKKLLK